MASGFLRVQGSDVLSEDGQPVILRGAGLGGWMKYVYEISSCLLLPIDNLQAWRILSRAILVKKANTEPQC